MKFDDAWTGPDKIKHLVGCILIALVVSAVTQDAFDGFVTSALLAAAKEFIYDLAMKKGTCSFQDLVVSVAGGALGSAVYLIAQGVL